MHAWAAILHDLLKWGTIAAEVIAFALVPAVILRRKEPASTAAWILTLVFLPALGATLFVLFGRDRIRMPVQRKREGDARVRVQLAESTDRGEGLLPADGASTDERERALFRVAARLSHARPREGNLVEVLADGNRAYEALFAAIDSAKHHVHAQYYLVRDDDTGRAFRDRLVAAAERGVHVRLLLDGFGCFALPTGWARPLRKAGGQIARFLPMRYVLLQPVNLRNHRKIVVTDGHVAFTGGLNVGDEYRGGTMRGVGSWRDLHLRIEGPAAAELQRIFMQDWAFAHGRAIEPGEYFPAEQRAGDGIVAIVPSGPDATSEAIHHLFFGAIVGAKERVRVITPYFVPDQAMLVALSSAAMRGVAVEMIFPSRSNHRVTFHAGRSFYDALLAAGVVIYEYTPGMVHSKVMVVDRRVCLVGSANMDLRSFRLNFEVHALMHDPAAAERLEAEFESCLSKCAKVDLSAWRARPYSLHVREGAARLVSPLL
jgi:cardiolipin synthase